MRSTHFIGIKYAVPQVAHCVLSTKLKSRERLVFSSTQLFRHQKKNKLLHRNQANNVLFIQALPKKYDHDIFF